MDNITGITNFFYSTMIPAVGVIPIWFTHGRYWLLGENDWVETDSTVSHRALPGMIGFHLLLWIREHKHKRNPLPEVALGLWAIYVLQFVLQIFYVIHVNHDDDDSNKGHHDHHNTTHNDYCVASKYWNSVPVEFCSRMAMGLTIDIWVVMIATLFVSYWTLWDYHENDSNEDDDEDTPPPPPTPLPIRNNMIHIQQKMTESIGPARFWIPIWFTIGHSMLGSGCLLNHYTVYLLLESILIFLPFHYFLWKKYKQQQQQNTAEEEMMIPMDLTKLLVIYYGLHILTQLFVIPPPNNKLLQPYLHVATINEISLLCKCLLLLNMILIIGYYYFYEHQQQEEETQTPAPQTQTTETTTTARTIRPAAGEDVDSTLRVPLLLLPPQPSTTHSEGGGGRRRTTRRGRVIEETAASTQPEVSEDASTEQV